MRMFIRECVITEDLPFVLINAGYKRCPGRNGFAGKLETVNLVIDDDIVTEVHAARPTLSAAKNHAYSPLKLPEPSVAP
jgi:hypothetical protein